MVISFIQPNDVPGKLCKYYTHNKTSYNMAKYMANKTRVSLMDAIPYAGLLSTVSNDIGINSVTSEVLSRETWNLRNITSIYDSVFRIYKNPLNVTYN